MGSNRQFLRLFNPRAIPIDSVVFSKGGGGGGGGVKTLGRAEKVMGSNHFFLIEAASTSTQVI